MSGEESSEKPIDLKRQQNDAYTKWRRIVEELLPELSKRIFALREHGYMGCGFHWALERDLGYAIAKVCDYDDGDIYHSKDAFAHQIVIQVRVRQTFERLAKIEDELKFPGERLVCPKDE